MKIISVNYSDEKGGAARAAFRIHQSLLRERVDSTLRVVEKSSAEVSVISSSKTEILLARIRRAIGRLLLRGHVPALQAWQTTAVFSSSLVKKLNRNDSDLLHLHWVSSGMLSIEEVGEIKKPIVWTLHDMWVFCGAEHYVDDVKDARFRVGYQADNQLKTESGRDVNKWVWNRKRNSWKSPMTIVCPSHWLADCAKDSKLLGQWEVSVIGNPINTDKWKPRSKKKAKEKVGLHQSEKVVLFGAHDGGSNFIKGADLLFSALKHLKTMGVSNLRLVTFGQGSGEIFRRVGIPMTEMGVVNDDESLINLYNASDVMVVPSRMEAFGQTASESQACGTPVVAFDTSGLKDIVDHQKTGYLAEPLNPQDFAIGIHWVLTNSVRYSKLSVSARSKSVEYFSYPIIANQYKKLYESVVKNR